jgi:hypothetical protein
MVSSGMSRHAALVRTNVSEEFSASIIRVSLKCLGSYKSHTVSAICIGHQMMLWYN